MYPSAEDKPRLDKMIREWMDRGEREHESFVNEMNEAEDYFDNLQVPIGFTDQARSQFAKANSAPAPTSQTKTYIVVNQIVQSHENILGNFIKAKQTVTLIPHSRRDTKKVIPIRKALRGIEDKNRTFQRVAFPCIDNMLHKGLDWGKA